MQNCLNNKMSYATKTTYLLCRCLVFEFLNNHILTIIIRVLVFKPTCRKYKYKKYNNLYFIEAVRKGGLFEHSLCKMQLEINAPPLIQGAAYHQSNQKTALISLCCKVVILDCLVSNKKLRFFLSSSVSRGFPSTKPDWIEFDLVSVSSEGFHQELTTTLS